MQDTATAAAALQRGEIDWLQTPNNDLLPTLRANKNIVVRTILPTGLIAYMRFNHLTPPFNNPAIRRALIGAVNQSDYMIAINGADKTLWRDGVGYFAPTSPYASKAGIEKLTGKRDYARVKSDLEKAGYKGEKVVMLVAVNIPYLKMMGEVSADMFKKIGMNVDYVATDWTSVVQRRNKTEPAEQGGWNIFSIYDNGANELDPASHLLLRGNGKDARASAGRRCRRSRSCGAPGSRRRTRPGRRRSASRSSSRHSRTCRTSRSASRSRRRRTARTSPAS